CATFLLLIRITFEPQLIETFVSMRAVVEEIGGCCSTGAELKTCKLFFFGRNSFRINASYNSETRYYCCCFGDCCSTVTDSEALRFFWKKLEDSMKAVVEEVKGCCSTGAESKTCKLFFGRNLFRINANYDSETRAWKLLWKELEAVALLELYRKRVNIFFGRNSFRIDASYDSGTRINASYDKESRINASYDKESSMEAVVEGIGGCCSTGADSKTRQLFSFERNSFSNNAYYDKESRYYCCCFGDYYSTGTDSEALRYYCCCFGDCCSTGTDSEALRLFWKKLEDVLILQLSRNHRSSFVKGCFLIGTEYGAWRLFERKLADVALLQLNLEYGSSFVKDSFNSNANFDKEPRHYYCCFGGSCSTGTESGAWKLLLYWSRIKSVDVLLEKTGECGFTGADFETCRLFSFGRNSFSINDSYDKESSNNANYDKESRNCCSAGAGSEAWDNHFWSEQEAVVLLELDLKDGNSPGMKWRLIETVSEARRFSRNRLGAVVLLRPNLNMAVSLEQTRSCGLY
uniref:Uncharacterized protein n=1 Tax=Strongyloides stercoralis TaxID=6248 RepID=A0AAF5D1J9_STRER